MSRSYKEDRLMEYVTQGTVQVELTEILYNSSKYMRYLIHLFHDVSLVIPSDSLDLPEKTAIK